MRYIKKRATIFTGLTYCIAASLNSNQLMAHFQIADADMVDRIEDQGFENFNDIASYRAPLDWAEQWRHANNTAGAYFNAGSLDLDRLHYQESVFLRARNLDNSGTFASYNRDVLENYVDLNRRNQATLGYRWDSHQSAFLIGEGGTLKEFSDMGFGFQVSGLTLKLISTDHYFNEKRSTPQDKRESGGLSFSATFDTNLEIARTHLVWNSEHDSPLHWERYSRGYIYKRDNYKHKITAHTKLSSGELLTNASYQLKSEEKTWQNSLDSAPTGNKSTRREETTLGTEYQWQTHSAQTKYNVGTLLILQKAKSSYRAFQEDQPLPEPASPPEYQRIDWGFHAIKSEPWHHNNIQLQYGGFLNIVERYEQNPRIEFKGQFGAVFPIHKTASFYLNTTWNIDRLIEDIPYNESAFRPWGGGNFQIQITI